MQLRSVDVGQAFQWYLAGWRAFMSAPLPWVGMAILNLLIAMALSLVPVIGNLLFMLVSPLLTGGLLHAARETRAGRPIGVTLLFFALNDSALRRRLLTLGAFMALASLLAGVIWLGLFSGPLTPGNISVRVILGYLFLFSFVAVLATAMFFAVPLLLFTDATPVEALKTSLHACLVNILSLTVFGLISLVLAFFAAIPLFLGVLVFLPVSVCALYASFLDIFEGAS